MEDEPVIKPRRLRGTPAFKYRSRLAWYIVGGMYAIHLIQVYFLDERIDRKVAVGWYDESNYMKDKKARMRNLAPFSVGTNIALQELDQFEDDARDHLAISPLDGDLRS